ncbi:MAG: SDR family oxidoreductase [Enterobacterales bacterium]|nr:SDR family oxidoreductase [Enterobacterales bacterium]
MKTIFYISLLLMSVTYMSTAYADNHKKDEPQKAVLITGATTGIGRLTAETLAKEGYFVYAGARKQRDMDELNKIPNIQAVKIDVTKQSEVDAAVAAIKQAGRGLYGLVNNAGVGSGGPLIEQSEDDIRWLFDVIVFGVFKVTQAFAPLIIESKGRIVNIGSISGVLTWMGGGDYTMSKHAIEAYSETLSIEMERFGVMASVVQPGNFNSDISKSIVKRRGEMTEAQKNSPYADYYKRGYENTGDRTNFKEPVAVVDAVKHALFDEKPRIRYMVVPDKKEAGWTIGASIRRVVQRNENQENTFSREELIKMLDDAIAEENK